MRDKMVSTIQPPAVAAVSAPTQRNASAGVGLNNALISGTSSRHPAARRTTETTESSA
jgi:hypothetical protein